MVEADPVEAATAIRIVPADARAGASPGGLAWATQIAGVGARVILLSCARVTASVSAKVSARARAPRPEPARTPQPGPAREPPPRSPGRRCLVQRAMTRWRGAL